ncbi:MAG: modification methylase HemK [Deltaproteobacteria bacterium SG8_13]|nr:MAG: modification methylase HemK [Deltaproteobacteria bacterium SG8_13]
MQNQAATGDKDWNILKLLQWTTSYFKSRGIENPRAGAEILLASVLQLERVELYVRHDLPLSAEELGRFKEMIRRRAAGEPVAYIVGRREFWSMDFAVTPAVLIPRPETECLVEAALQRLEKNAAHGQRVLELGTGCGAVILVLAAQAPQHEFFASDASAAALGVARNNACTHGLEENVRFVCGNWLDPVHNRSARFDMILSNPPYIRRSLIDHLQVEIRRFEPLAALDGGEDGLRCLEKIIDAAAGCLRAGGHLLLEIGHDQKEAVAAMIERAGGYEDVTFLQDYGGHDRVASMRRQIK